MTKIPFRGRKRLPVEVRGHRRLGLDAGDVLQQLAGGARAAARPAGVVRRQGHVFHGRPGRWRVPNTSCSAPRRTSTRSPRGSPAGVPIYPAGGGRADLERSSSACAIVLAPLPSSRTRCLRRSAASSGCWICVPRFEQIHRPAELSETQRREASPEVGRGAAAAGRARPAPVPSRCRIPHARARPSPAASSNASTPGCPFTLTPGPGGGLRRDRGRSRADASDAPAAAGRGRLRQDGRGAAGHAHGGGQRRAGGAAGPDRGARAAAPSFDHRAARPARAARPVRRRPRRH